MTVNWIFRLTDRRRLIGFGLAAVALIACLAGFFWQIRSVEITHRGNRISRLTFGRTVDEALSRSGISPGPFDRVEPSGATVLRQGLWAKNQVSVHAAFPVRIVAGGEPRELLTAVSTVGEAVEQFGLTVGPLDRVTPSLTAPLNPGQEIEIVRVERRVKTVSEPVGYQVTRRPDSSLEKGQEVVLRTGEDGVREITLIEEFENGRMVNQTVQEEKMIRDTVPEVVAYGTTDVVSRGGQSFRFRSSMIMRASAYTPGPESNPWGNGYTATGVRAGRGVVAVDPSVIPLGSRVFVEGYGYALAADVGGSIKGNRIDLCFNEVGEALRFGVRSVKVYLLAD